MSPRLVAVPASTTSSPKPDLTPRGHRPADATNNDHATNESRIGRSRTAKRPSAPVTVSGLRYQALGRSRRAATRPRGANNRSSARLPPPSVDRKTEPCALPGKRNEWVTTTAKTSTPANGRPVSAATTRPATVAFPSVSARSSMRKPLAATTSRGGVSPPASFPSTGTETLAATGRMPPATHLRSPAGPTGLPSRGQAMYAATTRNDTRVDRAN